MAINKIKKKGQEELVGFALIIILVSIILLVLLGFSLKKPNKEIVESYEAESFVQSLLQYTSECTKSSETDYLSVDELIFSCTNRELCFNGIESCEILNSTLHNLIEKSWEIGENNLYKGYEFIVRQDEKNLIFPLVAGLTNTTNSKGTQYSSPRKKGVEVIFNVYY